MITNVSKHIIISQKEVVCSSLLSQVRGLMFRKKQNLLMVFQNEQRISLHNFFVFYPIDLVFLNEKREVVEIKRDFKPFCFYKSKERAKYLIEFSFSLPENSLSLGDVLKIE